MNNKFLLGKYVSFDADNTTWYRVLDVMEGYVYIDTQCGYIWEKIEYICHLIDLDKILSERTKHL